MYSCFPLWYIFSLCVFPFLLEKKADHGFDTEKFSLFPLSFSEI